jgi:hypothetical protein
MASVLPETFLLAEYADIVLAAQISKSNPDYRKIASAT